LAIRVVIGFGASIGVIGLGIVEGAAEGNRLNLDRRAVGVPVIGEARNIGSEPIGPGILDRRRCAILRTISSIELGCGRQRRLIGSLLKLGVHCGEARIVESDAANGNEPEKRESYRWRNCCAIIPK
jgi:hypothetical protein